MLIETILKHKGEQVITVHADALLGEAARLMDQNRIGAVIVMNRQDNLVGVLSERDIVRCFARNGTGSPDMTVSEVMTRTVVTTKPNESLDTCLGRMTDRRCRHLPVVHDGHLTGIVSIGDLVKYKIDSVTAEAEAMAAYIKSG